MKKGNITVSTENIFPVIKKWLYSDRDIFLRELVSNGCDAVTKMRTMFPDDEYSVSVELNAEDKTITVSDNGIGMTEDEVLKYIAQVAFSGAEEFLEKYKDAGDENTIIGHFGLGFYSAFMVSDYVEVSTLSHEEGAAPVLWSCDGGTEYEISKGAREVRGTDIILHISEDSAEFLDKTRLRGILDKYCAFLPTPIYFFEKGEERGEPINDTSPLWTRKPSECTEEDYNAFYKKVFMDFENPLFYIHLNVEYPFNLKGILYFPKLKSGIEPTEGQIKLFNNQVFVADNIKEVIPEFMLLLKGVIDCPDLPLNVSRSFLQNDGYAAKVSAHITKKVADKLISLFNTERESYNKYWEDINPFIKFGCLKDEKFYDKVKNIIIYKTTADTFVTLPEYLEEAEKNGHKGEVYYVTDPVGQGSYIDLFKSQGITAVLLPGIIDNPFITFTESKNADAKFMRIDSSLASALKKDKDDGADGNEALIEMFKKAVGNDSIKIEAATLTSPDMPAVILVGEQTRRFAEMSKMYGLGNIAGETEQTLTLNLSNPVVEELRSGSFDEETAEAVCKQIFDIARITLGQLDSASLAEFTKRCSYLMSLALKK